MRPAMGTSTNVDLITAGCARRFDRDPSPFAIRELAGRTGDASAQPRRQSGSAQPADRREGSGTAGRRQRQCVPSGGKPGEGIGDTESVPEMSNLDAVSAVVRARARSQRSEPRSLQHPAAPALRLVGLDKVGRARGRVDRLDVCDAQGMPAVNAGRRSPSRPRPTPDAWPRETMARARGHPHR